MRTFILTVLLSTSLLIATEALSAQDRGFGVGAVIGGPDGIAYKTWFSENMALAGAVSFSISENNSSFYTHADILKHKFYDNLDWETGRLSYYYGGGLSLLWRDGFGDNTFVALRMPGGFSFNMTDAPVDVFIELAPTIDVSPNFMFSFNGGIGFRFYLN